MDRQEIFDTVAKHLLTQNARSTFQQNGATHCAYRGDNGRKCAAGCLIQDIHYNPELEGKSVIAFEVSEALGKSIGDSDLWFLKDLQHIHDGFAAEKWREELRHFAKSHNVKEDVLNAV